MAPVGFNFNGRPLSAAVAKKEINRIRGDHGHIDAHDEQQLDLTDAEFQEGYRRRAQVHREVYARYTKTVAEQLYTSKFRFIYELIQNADDARYETGVQATMRFILKPTELVVESNEKGFTLANVDAICSTGKSSKVGDDATTGEKGLGFKSVFGIAGRVHIHSGHWTFRFEHTRGQDGVGMITPIWTETDEVLPLGIGTRYILRYSDTGPKFLDRLISEFEKLPRTLTFALRQLKAVAVDIDGVHGVSSSIEFAKVEKPDELSLRTKVLGGFGDHQSETTRLMIFQKAISDMPQEELRNGTTSLVTIALEVDERGSASIPSRGHHVFAYLPVCRLSGLPFLINANFVLAANREGIPDCPWNLALVDGITDLFANVMEALSCAHGPLRLTWMRYLPADNMEGIFEDLFDHILNSLKYRKVVVSRKGRNRKLSSVRYLPDWFVYEQEPLVPDTSEDAYLSSEYDPSDMSRLKRVGLRKIEAHEIVERLVLDLSSSSSVLRQKPLDDPWHTQFALLIQRLLTNIKVKAEVKSLEIIPLNDGGWVSLSSSERYPVYLPYLVDEDPVYIEVPEGLGLRKLHPTAYGDGERIKIYEQLGISTCRPSLAIRNLEEAHFRGKRQGNIIDFRNDVEMLFWFGWPGQFSIGRPDCAISSLKEVPLASAGHKAHKGPALFFPSAEEFHAQELLAATSATEFVGFGFLHDTYMESNVRHTIRYGMSWLSWLRACGVSYFPQLAESAAGGYRLNRVQKLIARDKPEKFIPNLQEHWMDYRIDASRISGQLRELLVSCSDGTSQELCKTILPTADLLEKSVELRVKENLPFLKLPDAGAGVLKDTWSFLDALGVVCEANTVFYLLILRLLSHSEAETVLEACTRIYAGIATCTKVGDAKTIRDVFTSQSLVCTANASLGWVTSAQCVWRGPQFLSTKAVLHDTYGQDANASTFFSTFLRLPDADYMDIVDELTLIACRGAEDIDLVPIYTSLAAMVTTDSAADNVRKRIEQGCLIYAKQRWLRPSECLWNCTVEISGRVPLEQSYPKLKKFFAGQMRVMTMNADVLVQELARVAKKSSPDIDELKRIMLGIGQLLGADPETQIQEQHIIKLEDTSFLPVKGRNGRSCQHSRGDFCVNDHIRYAQVFDAKVNILDFEYNDLQLLHPLFQRLRLDHRYISVLVTAETTAEDTSLSDGLTAYMRDRAYALSCCANFYHSPHYFNRQTRLHDLLLNTEVYVSEKMATQLTIRETTGDVVVESDRVVVKLHQSETALHIYVPADEDGLYSCFHTELPGELAKLLGIQNRAASKVVYRIINDQAKDSAAIMKDEDLADCHWLSNPPPLHRRANIPSTSNTTEDLDSTTPGSGSGLVSEPRQVFTPEADSVVHEGTRPSRSSAHNVQPLPRSPAHTSVPAWQQEARKQQYKKLLKEVVRQAKRVSGSRAGDPLSLAEIDEALDDLEAQPDYLMLRMNFLDTEDGTFEQNSRIGAAGELFVFECLKASGVLDFGIDNWQSTMRRHVKVLDEYREMPDWTGKELSDIMYGGHCARLRQFLRQNTSDGYPRWLGSDASNDVLYHLEVKTTTGPCDTPFFMSQKQYDMIQELACDQGAATAPRALYVVLRVYNLCSGQIGLKVYIDPWNLRNRALQFRADRYTVTPCSNG